MKSGRSLVSLAQELERQLATKRDLVVPSSLLRCRTDAQDEDQKGAERITDVRRAMRQMMWDRVGLVRCEKDLNEALFKFWHHSKPS